MAQALVIGAGIAGLTAGALLAQAGYQTLILEQAQIPGGCASTFRRRGFTFDVGATQVAGLEPGGIHHRIFSQLGIELPPATPCDPACAVFLPGETEPIRVWRDPQRWQEERSRQFPGSERFWQLMDQLFAISWRFQQRDPVVPARNLWDWGQLIRAMRPDTLLTLPFALMTVGDLLNLLGLGQDYRLRTFLDLQLKLYSQVDAEETALLYAATALGVSQTPQGLFHLKGSMQVLSDRLLTALKNHGGELRCRQRVEAIHHENGQVTGVRIRDLKTQQTYDHEAQEIIANITPQNLLPLLTAHSSLPTSHFPLSTSHFPLSTSHFPLSTSHFPRSTWQHRITHLPTPSGAFVVYLGVDQAAIPADCPPHLQFLYNPAGEIGENNSLFVSVSQPGDGRAPDGCATIIASSFVKVDPWWEGDYPARKQAWTEEAIAKLGQYFHLTPDTIHHSEAATPRTFERYTGRDRGYVGGLSQRIATFGPFGLGPRTAFPHLWLVGDSIHPGEGTAGVSYGAYTAVQQILAQS
ncbi:FAD-dependent oxidoreductase [Spirulina sp. CCNP1310]|uniref:FAD-dependent oxidoreductase n=1 Tax=Spirulina sp. CCNP1310 TaxID=3110249 RepID=UPI002B1F3584|nr:FAD-dependent oxidoreductase [Spirulina sp. CCNP1310]MEA5417807.1 FAD-dependent oxidoreductase [Spirulina sp. CCNP1310]